jgi:hypothetical protein
VGSSPSAGATPTDAAILLSPPTDDGDNHDNKGEGRRDEMGEGGRQGTRAVGGRRKAREWRMMKAAADGDGGRSDRVKQVLSKFSGALQKIQG